MDDSGDFLYTSTQLPRYPGSKKSMGGGRASGAVLAGEPNCLITQQKMSRDLSIMRCSDLRPLSVGLPSLIALCDYPYSPVDRIISQFFAAGVDASIINMSTRVRTQAEHHHLRAFRHVCGDEQKNFQKLKVFQTLFEKKHPCLDKRYDTFFFNFDLSLPLEKMEPLRKSGIFFVGFLHALLPLHKLPRLLKNKTGVLRPSMAQPFTGFCVYTAGCRKWQTTGCANCPQLGISTAGKDECKEYFDKKLDAFSSSSWNLTVVPPSRWLGEEISQSLIGKRYPYTPIATSVQLDLFRPHDKSEARRLLGLPNDRDVLLIGSAGLRKNKGFPLLCKTLSHLAECWKTPPLLVFFGYAPENTSLLDEAGIPWKAMGWVENPVQLAMVYSAADIFVSPSFQDNLPNTVNESLACGTPVVCFDRFSSEEVVIDGITGMRARHPGLPLSAEGELRQTAPYEVAPEDCTDFAEKIFSMLSLPEEGRHILRQNCRKFAERAFSPTLQAARYLHTFREMLGLPDIQLSGLDHVRPDEGLTKIDG